MLKDDKRVKYRTLNEELPDKTCIADWVFISACLEQQEQLHDEGR
jgi:hypothetical protein